MSKQKLAGDLVRLVRSNWLRFVVYTIIGLVALQFPLANVAAAKGQTFTLFEFLAPVAGILLGPWLGAVQVVATKAINVGVTDATWTLVEVLRLFPLALAAFYFGSKRKYPAYLAVLAILAFVIHPIGRQVWFYSLYWLIPVAAVFFKQNPIVNALGSTFTAHAVGGALFIWGLNVPQAIWLRLIPVVAVERAFFALGIVVTAYVVKKVVEHRWSKLALTARLSHF